MELFLRPLFFFFLILSSVSSSALLFSLVLCLLLFTDNSSDLTELLDDATELFGCERGVALGIFNFSDTFFLSSS